MKRLLVSLAFLVFATPALAQMVVDDAYARVATPKAKAGAAYLVLRNTSEASDRLIAVESDAAARVELHTHQINDGVMHMTKLEDGIEIEAGAQHALERGGDHLMFMGLADSWSHGDAIPLTLVFENAGRLEIDIVVDLQR